MKTNAAFFLPLSPKRKARLILQLTAFTFIIQICLSSKLWLADRLFPHAPLLPHIQLAEPWDFLIPGALLCTLLLTLFCRNWILYLAIVLLAIALVLFDLNRLQPWTYVFLVIFSSKIIAAFLRQKHFVIGIVQLIIIALFFWSGVSKMNPHFLEGTYLSILAAVFNISDLAFFEKYQLLGLFFPLTEIMVALFLLFSKTRKLGIWLAVFSHLFIIYFVSPWGMNNDFIVIPWNLLMILLALLVFNPSAPILGLQWTESSTRKNYALYIGLLFILPALNLIGQWDDYLSFSLYSNKAKRLMIAVKDADMDYLPLGLQDQFQALPGVEGGRMMNTAAWSFAEMNVPYYPSPLVLNRMKDYFCELEIPEEGLAFLIYKGRPGTGRMENYGCGEKIE